MAQFQRTSKLTGLWVGPDMLRSVGLANLSYRSAGGHRCIGDMPFPVVGIVGIITPFQLLYNQASTQARRNLCHTAEEDNLLYAQLVRAARAELRRHERPKPPQPVTANRHTTPGWHTTTP